MFLAMLPDIYGPRHYYYLAYRAKHFLEPGLVYAVRVSKRAAGSYYFPMMKSFSFFPPTSREFVYLAHYARKADVVVGLEHLDSLNRHGVIRFDSVVNC